MNSNRSAAGRFLCFAVLGMVLLFTLTINGDAGNLQNNSPRKTFLPLLSNQFLSPAQLAFIGQIGYPQQFIKRFSYEGARERVDEIWVYTQKKLLECFINGVFVKESTFSGDYAASAPSVYKPQDFQHRTTTQHVIARFGQPSSQKQETIWNGTLKTYAYPSIIFVFNNDLLVSLIALR